MRLRTNKDVHTVTLDPGDTLLVDFHPMGYNAPAGSIAANARLTTSISTMTLPSGRMALQVAFPPKMLYQQLGRDCDNAFVVLDDPVEPEELTITYEDGPRLRFKRHESEQ